MTGFRLILFVLLVAVVSSAQAGYLDSFLYKSPRPWHEITNVKQKKGSTVIAIMVHSYLRAEPKGIAQFPDGGAAKITDEKATLYVADMTSRMLTRRAEIAKPPELLPGTVQPWIMGWQGDNVYVSYSGQRSTQNVAKSGHFFAIDKEGAVTEIPALPKDIWAGWDGLPVPEKPLRLTVDRSTIEVWKALDPNLTGIKITLSPTGILQFQTPN